jgi:hypothetical protein
LYASREEFFSGDSPHVAQSFDEDTLRAGIPQFSPLHSARGDMYLTVDAHQRDLVNGRDAFKQGVDITTWRQIPQ